MKYNNTTTRLCVNGLCYSSCFRMRNAEGGELVNCWSFGYTELEHARHIIQ